MRAAATAVVTTEVFVDAWYRAGHTEEEQHLLTSLLRITPTFGICQERFMFVEEGLEPGLYTRRNDFGTGFILVGFFGSQAPLYVLELFETEREAIEALTNAVSRLAVRTYCEKIFNEWVTVR
jgi:hypothetical protein